MLALVFHHRLRWCAAGLFLTATGLAGSTAVLAAARLGVGPALAFTAVAVIATVLAVAVLHGAQWALWITFVGSGGQVAAVVGTVWQLVAGIDASKATEIRRLGFDPTIGVLVNLAYSATAVALFCWLALRWQRLRHAQRPIPP